jgi:hypothetical protein
MERSETITLGILAHFSHFRHFTLNLREYFEANRDTAIGH